MNINIFRSAHHKNGTDYAVNRTDYESVCANGATIRTDYMNVGANGATIRSLFIPKSAKMDVFLRF